MPPEKPRFVISRPIAAALLVVALFAILGLFAIIRTPQSASETTLRAWGGGLPIEEGGARSNTAPASTTASSNAIDAPVRPLIADDARPQARPDEYVSFFARVARSPQQSAGTSSIEAQIKAVFSAVPSLPSGFGTVSARITRTPQQEALFSYGNTAGAIIKEFEQQHADEQDVLAAQASNRNDAKKAAALRALAADLGAIGDKLSAIPHVPASAQAGNAALAQSYREIGAELALVADAGADDAKTLAAIKTYDASAERFTGRYIALMDLFALADVTFSNADAGSVFTFSFSGTRTAY